MKKSCNYAFLMVFAFTMMSCGNEQTPKTETKSASTENTLLKEAQNYFEPLPSDASTDSIKLSPALVLLGKTLYFDVRLSKNNTQSCNTCHQLANFGVDNESFSTGDVGKKGGRNSPTVYNAALHIAQFWDGRAKTIEDQAGMPVLNPIEMNMPSEKFVEERIKKITGYKKLFTDAFPNDNEPMSYSNIKKAIGAFERTLLTPSNFDKYLAGDENALSAEEQAGLKEFIATGCGTCHMGKTVGGAMFQKFPLIGADYKSLTGSQKEDLGKMEQSKDAADKFVFKVPSLRNITQTGPYFHDGSVNDLGKAIKIMGKLQLNKDLSDEQVDKIKSFLACLKGQIPVGADKTPTMPQ